MLLDPDLIAIATSAILVMGIGYVWYHPSVFGTAWMRMSNITPEMAERGKKRMPLLALVGLLAAALVAYVMSYVSAAWGFYDWQGALQLGFWCWAGFVAPTMLGMVLWEQKPFKLYLINVLYWLVAMLVIAQIIVFVDGFIYASGYYDAGLDTGEYVGE